MQLYLIRHAEPRDCLGRCFGRLDLAVDPEANASAALAVRERLPSSILQHALIYTSPLSRCAALANALACPRNAIVDPDLVEMDFGAWEGRRWDTVPREELDRWADDVWRYRPGGGESVQAVAARWHGWLERLRHGSGGAVIAVTHAGIIRIALAHAGQVVLSEFDQVRIEFGSVHQLEITDRSFAALQRMEVRV
jgi:alpha-ribazole phosphatase